MMIDQTPRSLKPSSPQIVVARLRGIQATLGAYLPFRKVCPSAIAFILNVLRHSDVLAFFPQPSSA